MSAKNVHSIICEVRRKGSAEQYIPCSECGIDFSYDAVSEDDLKRIYRVTVTNTDPEDFHGIINVMVKSAAENPKFFMPGYMYDRNTADMPSSGRKAFPRIKENASTMPESSFFMTRSDRLAEPISLIYDNGTVMGISAVPVITGEDGSFVQYCGFSCCIEEGCASAGYMLGYENAPWLFVQTATVREREPLSDKNSFVLAAGDSYSFDLTVYSYSGEDERAIYPAIEDCYLCFHESPRSIEGMDAEKALNMLCSAIRDYAWLDDEQIYTGFVYDRPEGFAYNRIPSISWTNGLVVAVPMIIWANRTGDETARSQSLTFIDNTVKTAYNPSSGLLYESVQNGKPSVRGWWYNGMHSGGHSSYINGQAIYYILQAYCDEKEKQGVLHEEWLSLAGKVVERINKELNTDFEYPFSMSENTGAGLEYDSMGSAWCLAATALYEQITGDRGYMDLLKKSEDHYYNAFIRKVECYGGPLDTDKAVDSEGVLSYIRAVRILQEITGNDGLLDHLRDALYYEFTFKLGYNTHITYRPLSEIGWSSCGGSITSVANPHIHPMSSTVIGEMRYYLQFRDDRYVRNRLDDTVGWSLQTFNTKDREYGYGRAGWMSERFCFCEGLLTEKYPNGETASTWFALMPWASGSIIEGLTASVS